MKNKPLHTKLVVLSAPSGAGKSTLAQMLLQRQTALFSLSISHTTRAPRVGEVDGTHYFFVSEEKFSEMIRDGHFLEYAHVFKKNYYGTSKKYVEKILDEGKTNILFDIDVQGASSLKKAFGNRCVTVFILPPTFEELERRLRTRATENPKDLEARLLTAKEEMTKAPEFDYRLVNQEIEKTYEALETILKKEGCLR